jgi:hypothetical protein
MVFFADLLQSLNPILVRTSAPIGRVVLYLSQAKLFYNRSNLSVAGIPFGHMDIIAVSLRVLFGSFVDGFQGVQLCLFLLRNSSPQLDYTFREKQPWQKVSWNTW